MKILVADDDITSRAILKSFLTKWGFEEAIIVDNGEAAWDVLRQPEGPRLSILDWMMPELDGIEICKRMKALDPSAYIIMITSAEEPDAISTALYAGADDFIAKPFKAPELQARLEVGKRMLTLHTRISEANIELKHYANEMETLAREKANQLIHAERLSTIGLLTAGVAHEINNPTTFISGNVQTLLKFWPFQEKVIRACPEDHPDHEKLTFIHDETPQILAGIQNGARRIASIVSGLQAFARQEPPQKIEFDLHEAIEAALMLCHNSLKYNVSVEKIFESQVPKLTGDPQKIEQVFVNLFGNAADAMEGKKEGLLEIRTNRDGSDVTITVTDNGPGLSEEALKKIWDPFFTTKPVGKGTGLGMSISHGIVESHGGTITAANRPKGGAEFVVRLPVGGVI